MEYIKKAVSKKPEKCIFCVKPREKRDSRNYILYRGRKCFIIMNLFPYNNGHLMIAPYKHTASLEALDDETLLEVMALLKKSESILKKAFNPDGFNIGVNIGRTAGAGIDKHIHFHIVPRWNGDTNFLPVIDDTKVIVQSMEAAYKALSGLFKDIRNVGSKSRRKNRRK